MDEKSICDTFRRSHPASPPSSHPAGGPSRVQTRKKKPKGSIVDQAPAPAYKTARSPAPPPLSEFGVVEFPRDFAVAVRGPSTGPCLRDFDFDELCGHSKGTDTFV